MVFSNFDIINKTPINILVYNKVPMTYIKKLKYYEESVSGTFYSKKIRWSNDKTYWSNWILLKQTSLTDIIIDVHDYLYLEVLYTLNEADSGKVNSFSVYGIHADDKDKDCDPCARKWSVQTVLENFMRSK